MKNNKIIYPTLLAAFLYELLLSLQGFDLCDEGWELSAFQQFFHSPECAEYQFLYYLSIFVGGVWEFLFGFGGILSFRILSVIVVVLTAYITCSTVIQYIKDVDASLFLVFPIAVSMILLLSNFGVTVFDHNYLTILFVAVSFYFMLKGLNRNSYKQLFVGALFCGMNIFSRIPNVTMLVVVGLLLVVDYWYERDAKRLGKNVLFASLGVLSGIGLVLLLMLLCGHLELFYKSITVNLLSTGLQDNSNHNFAGLIKILLSNYRNVYCAMGVFVFSTAVFAFVLNRLKYKWIKIAAVVLFAGILLLSTFRLFKEIEQYYGLILFPLLASCYVDRKNKPVILLNVASLSIMLLLPLGSDIGLGNMGSWSIWLATFVSVCHILRYVKGQIAYKRNYSYAMLMLACLVLYAGHHLSVVSKYAYFDGGSRLEKRFRADNDKFTVFTTRQKTQIIDELLAALTPHVKPGDYLLCFESLPMIHYLTETKPYMGNSWPWTYDPANFRQHLEAAEASLPLPVIVRQKCQPLGGRWTVPDTTVQSTDSYLYKQNRVDCMEEFIKRHDYAIAWANELFAVYTKM